MVQNGQVFTDVPVVAVSRFVGTSIAMIGHHYGHLANDSRDHAVALLEVLVFERAVVAGWTSTRTPQGAPTAAGPPLPPRATHSGRRLYVAGRLWSPPPRRPHPDELKTRTFQIAVRRRRRTANGLAGTGDNRGEAEVSRPLESGGEQCPLGASPSLLLPGSCEA